MTRCEQLYNKANNCLACARRTDGRMSDIWLNHFYSIMNKIRNMSIKELSEVVS